MYVNLCIHDFIGICVHASACVYLCQSFGSYELSYVLIIFFKFASMFIVPNNIYIYIYLYTSVYVCLLLLVLLFI